ncbi:MAG TPA: glycosyltransferase family 25 protein [Acidimicrobiales bacterium]|nr:glycosyltransferase family 25 protein [Acidimicrobiales bacterium]
MKAFVINLPRSPERREFICRELERARVEYAFVDAVDGRDLDLHDTRLVHPDLLEKDYFKPGVAGCALSHIRVYEKVIGEGLPFALVLEDDATLPADLDALSHEVARHMEGAEIVLLNYTGPQGCKLSTHGAIPLSSSRYLAYPVRADQVFCSAAYVITGEACRRMVRDVLPVKTHADEWWYFHQIGTLDRVRCVAPCPVDQDKAFRTTIDFYSPQSLQHRLRDAIIRNRVPVLTQARSLRWWFKNRRLRRTALLDEAPDQLRPGGPGQSNGSLPQRAVTVDASPPERAVTADASLPQAE